MGCFVSTCSQTRLPRFFLPVGPSQHLLEGGDLPAAVVEGVLLAVAGDALLGAQGLQLGEGEVLGEPAGVGDAVDDFVVFRPANSGCAATSVVPVMSFS